MKLLRLITLTAVVSAVFLSGIANAEGYWTSSMFAHPEFESRRWVDNHNDAATTSTYFSGCRDEYGNGSGVVSGTITLYRDIDFWPDEDRGTVTLYCYYSATGYFGEQPTAGTFHWTLKKVDGTTTFNLSVSYIEQDY